MLSQRTAISIKKELCNLDFLVEVFSQPLLVLAEPVGFEPTWACTQTVFKISAA